MAAKLLGKLGSESAAPVLVESVFEVIKEINSEGTTILLVEQNAMMALNVAARGYSGKINAHDLSESLSWRIDLKEFCDKVGIPWQDPSWVLASWWDGP